MNKATKQLSKLFAAMALAGAASYSVAADTIKIALPRAVAHGRRRAAAPPR